MNNQQKDDDDVDQTSLVNLLSQIAYADNVVYVHSDPKLMPSRRRAWASWNCIGKSALMSSYNNSQSSKSKQKEAFEGADSGFGNKASKVHSASAAAVIGGEEVTTDNASHQPPQEGSEGRMKAVYITYWLNRLQNLETDQQIFVSLNPHETPDPALCHKRVIWGHPQFNPDTLQARKVLEESYQGKQGLWFCGAWQGYGFHEDGCRSGFQVATKLSGVALPWANKDDHELMVLPPPDLAVVTAK